MNRNRKKLLTRARVSKYRHMNSDSSKSSEPTETSTSEYSDTNSDSVRTNPAALGRTAAFDSIIELSESQDDVFPKLDLSMVHVIPDDVVTGEEAHSKGLECSSMSDSDTQSTEEYHSAQSDGECEVEEISAQTNLVDDVSPENEIQEIRQWAVESNISQTHLDKLLSILRKRLLPELPKSSKTFLQTSYAIYNIEKMEDYDGQMSTDFVYFGIASGLEACVDETVHSTDTIYLQINIDGMPLFKSSAQQMWPILCKVHFDPNIYDPFLIAVYLGAAKPKSLHLYLDKFITEIDKLLKEGIVIGKKLFQIRIKCFVCDTPARSFLKCIKGHGGYYACERCTVRGERSNGRMIYPSTDSPKRTDASFRNFNQPEHHNGSTPLTLLPIDMISICVLNSMHLFYGVMKKILVEFWLGGNRRTKLGRRSKEELARRMECIKLQVPCEFQRKPGSIAFVAKWKATQFRFFLLYCAPIILKRVLSRKLYKHFLLLHVACRILCTPELAVKYNEAANRYLHIFFCHLSRYYGPDSQIINMHNLIHVSDDVKTMGCSLSEITSFPFENMLGKIKKILQTPNRPLAQLCRRLYEVDICGAAKKKAAIPRRIVVLKQGHTSDVNTGRSCIYQLKYNGAVISVRPPNDMVILKDGTILKVEGIHAPKESPEEVIVEGKIWRVKKSLFKFPCDSKELGMWELQDKQSTISKTCSISLIRQKLVKLSLGRSPEDKLRVYVIPLLHN